MSEGNYMPGIIILRGNSGSGKSTVAKAPQKKIGTGTLVAGQRPANQYLREANKQKYKFK